MILPAFLSNGSPPRSPHVPNPNSLSSYFSTMGNASSSPSTSRYSHFSFRPSRRDVVLCLLTLSFSYLLFSPQPTSQQLSGPIIPIRGYRIPSWSKIFTSSSECPDVTPTTQQMTFGESAKMIGPMVSSVSEVDEFARIRGGKPWDQGDEAEDDALQSAATVLEGHQPGWTLMERLYVYNGSFYVVA